MWTRPLGHRGHHARHGTARVVEAEVEQHGDEFLAAHAGDEIVGVAAGHAQRVGHHAQAVVALQVTVGVVVLLEAIDVEQRKRDGATVAARVVKQARLYMSAIDGTAVYSDTSGR